MEDETALVVNGTTFHTTGIYKRQWTVLLYSYVG